MRLDVEVDAADAEARLERVVETLTDLRGLPLDRALEAARGRVRRRFDADLIRPAVRGVWRRRKGNRPTLVFEGHLRDSLTQEGARFSRRTDEPDAVTVTSSAPGARYARRRRKPVDLSSGDRRGVVDAFTSGLAESLR